MSHDNRTQVRRWFDEVWSQKRADVIDELMAEDAIGHGLGEGGGATRGTEEFKAFHQKFCQAFPDLRLQVEDVLAEGDLTAVRFTALGRHTGEGLELPPTGREVAFTGMVFTRWRDGQIAEGWNLIDFPLMQQQLLAP